MKLSEFVCCFGSPTSGEKVGEPAAGRPAEETRAFVGRQMYIRSYSCNNIDSAITIDERKKRGRVAEEWKPTLGSISENNVLVVVGEEAEEEKRAENKGSSRSGGGVGDSSSIDMATIAARYEESRRNYSGRAILTFTPVSFMF